MCAQFFSVSQAMILFVGSFWKCWCEWMGVGECGWVWIRGWGDKKRGKVKERRRKKEVRCFSSIMMVESSGAALSGKLFNVVYWILSNKFSIHREYDQSSLIQRWILYFVNASPILETRPSLNSLFGVVEKFTTAILDNNPPLLWHKLSYFWLVYFI